MNKGFENKQFRVYDLAWQFRAILLSVLFLIVSACVSTNPRGAATKETLVDVYLQALQQKDEQAILSLVPETLAAQDAVQAKVEQLGGHTFHQVHIGYVPQVNPKWVRVIIRGVYTGSHNEQVEFSDEIFLNQMDNRWYLMLGQDRNAVPPPTSQP